MSITNTDALTRAIDHREIFHDEMLSIVRRIMSGEMSPVMMAAMLVGLRVKKETIGEIMGLKHRTLDIEGVQFHPEAILTEHGHRMLRNFLEK